MKKTALLLCLYFLLAGVLRAESITEIISTYAKNQLHPVTTYELADVFTEMLATDPSYGTPVTFLMEDLARVRITPLDNSRFVVAYDTGNHGLLIVGEISPSNTISFGTAAPFSVNVSSLAIDAMGTNKVALAYRLINTTAFVQVANISGTTVTYGTAVQFATSTLDPFYLAAFSDAFVVSYHSSSDFRGRVESFVVSGATITEASEVIYNYSSTDNASVTKLGASDFVIAYSDRDNEGFGTVINGTIDSSTGEILRLGNEVVFEAQQIRQTRIRAVDDTRFLIAYHVGAVVLSDNPINVVVGEINTSKTQILQMGTPVNIASPDTDGFAITVTDAATFVINYSEPTDPLGDVISLSGDISGIAITGLSNPVTVLTDQTITAFNFSIDMATVGDKFVMAFDNQNANPNSNGDNTGDVLLGTLDGTALPVVMNTFGATVRGKNVELTWTTGSEADNRGFEVQRRHENGPWENIGFAEGQGTTSALSGYTFVDPDASPGVNYYRLRQVDYGGGHSFSSVVAVELSAVGRAAQDLLLYPNPVTDGTLTLDLPVAENVSKRIRVFSIGGQLLMERNQTGNTVSVGELPRGTYLLKVEVAGELSTGRFAVQ